MKYHLGRARPFVATLVVIAAVMQGTLSASSSHAVATEAPFAAEASADPVVFIHGIDSNASIWDRAVARFESRKYAGKTYVFDYRDTWQEPIDATAQRFRSWIYEQGLSGKRINVVGHSLGGLVARQSSTKNPGDVVLGSLVSLATPHYGARWVEWCSLLGTLVCSQAINDMSSSSPFLAELNQRSESWANRQNALAVRIGRDEAVMPESTMLRGASYREIATDAEELPKTTDEEGVGTGSWAKLGPKHGSLPFKKEAIDAAFDFIVAGNRARVLPSGPELYGGDCTFWSFSNGTIRWRVPERRPEGVVAEIVEATTSWKSVVVPIEQGVKEGLSYGDYRIRFVGPENEDGERYVTEWSSARLHVVGFRCRADISNKTPTITEFPTPAYDGARRIVVDGNDVHVEFDRALFEQDNRYIVYVDGAYSMETYAGTAYYNTGKNVHTSTVLVTDTVDPLPAGSRVDVYLADGAPGGAVTWRTLLMSHVVAP